MSDEVCVNLGIPEALHTCERPAIEDFAPGERLYRRVPPAGDHTLLIGCFDRKSSSVNRSSLSTADQTRWDTERGVYHGTYGVIGLPADVYQNREWFADDGKTQARFTVSVYHDPKRCNYSHTDFKFFRENVEVLLIQPKSVKMKIRDDLRRFIHRIL